MKSNITKEWCLRMALAEGDTEIGAGLTAIDPVFDAALVTVKQTDDWTSIAFGRLVELLRRQRGFSVETLAEAADVELGELVAIEENPHHKADARTVYLLANYFGLPRPKLMQLAGLTAPRDSDLDQAAVKFAARAEPTAMLSPEERAALEAFVAELSRA